MSDSRRSALFVALCVVVAGSWLGGAFGQATNAERTAPKLPSNELPPGCLQVVSQPGEPITAVVYDPQQQVLGVYHVDRNSGEIELKSIRQIQWDLQMLHFQGKAPLPQEIKNGLEGAAGH
ncbi:hypothetical protein [Aeoliella mucimassa]|uniref:Uncharacterized protein n=1 Tax=Aeoliella mucimassa TaxID=2527972 RepID=A0A518ANX4_9BACT|nr:hypothetical protein [Aeoliella mucimassa]QDU56422.1 hypothetical protein Pan181_26310 [Aeoliella mucimassa]